MNMSLRVRLAGTAYVVGGLLWFILGAVQTAIWGFDLPSGSPAFYVIETVFVITQMLLLFGFFGVLWSGGVGRSVFGKITFGLGALGHLVFVAGEAHSLMTGVLSDLVPVGALTSAVGILLTGIVVAAVKHWQGWTRWMPLLVGLYPWLVMFPFIFISDGPNAYAIVGWGLARVALGLAIRAQADATLTADTPTGAALSQRSG